MQMPDGYRAGGVYDVHMLLPRDQRQRPGWRDGRGARAAATARAVRRHDTRAVPE